MYNPILVMVTIWILTKDLTISLLDFIAIISLTFTIMNQGSGEQASVVIKFTQIYG